MNIIEINDVCFTYPDGTAALDGINFHVRRGEFVGILGANGSGKTTLLKIVNGLLTPARGEVKVDGKNINSVEKDMLFSKVCTMFQNPDDQLFSPTVSQDIAFGPLNLGLTKEEVDGRVNYALEAVEMLEFSEKTIHHLSFGQKKRICLAGVLAMEPEVILLDEPTSSLDPMGASSIMHLLKDLNRKKGLTFIMSTHSVDMIPLFSDRVVILNGGKVIKDGTPEEVFSDAEVIRVSKLRLPRIGHLFEILKKKDKIQIEHLPLTIGEAREEVKNLLSR